MYYNKNVSVCFISGDIGNEHNYKDDEIKSKI